MFTTKDEVYFENDKELKEYEIKEFMYFFRHIIIVFFVIGVIFSCIYLTSFFN